MVDEWYHADMSTYGDYTDPGHCGCPECTRYRLARGKAAREELDAAFIAAMHKPDARTAAGPSTNPASAKRCTRADREAVVEVLSQNYAAGSLDEDEFNDRVDSAMAAKFPSALAALTTDLPDLGPTLAERYYRPNEKPQPGWWDERPDFRVRSSGTLAAQNVTGMAANFAAVGIGVSSGNGVVFGLMFLVCCLINCMLGLRRSKGLAVVGFLTGAFAYVGTVAMIIATLRYGGKPRYERYGTPGERGW